MMLIVLIAIRTLKISTASPASLDIDNFPVGALFVNGIST